MLATILDISRISIEGNRSSSRIKGRKRITFIYSLYHDHSIKRSISSRDDRSSRWQHPHVVSQSFAICGNCRGGLRITEGLESQRLEDPYNLARPSIHLYLHFPRFVSFCPSFFSPRNTFLPSFLSFLFFSVVLSPSKQACLFLILISMRFLVQVKLFRGKIERISLFIFLFLQT